MVSVSSPEPGITSAKIVIAGGFAVGKTTCVAAISELEPINTEAWMTAAGEQVDPLDPGLVLYLFGTPGQPRFWPMWDDLCRGAVGALVLTDTRRLETSFAAVNYFEQDSDVPYVVCANLFDGVLTHPLDEVREALALHPDVPLISCDARSSGSVAKALLTVVEHTMRKRAGRRLAGANR
jgi:signal recognition particle receptor subunit beta